MNEEWKQTSDTGGVCGAETVTVYPDLNHEALQDIKRDYRWTPACQRVFLEELAFTGSVTRATKHVGKSPRSAYMLRFRHDGAAFRLAWEAAILIARATLADMLMDRAVCGYEEMTSKQDDGTVVRGKFDNKLSMNVLTRLDKFAEREAVAGSRDAQVQLVVQDFEAFLALIERGGTGADAAMYFEALEPCVGDSEFLKYEIECELAQNSGVEEEEAGPEYLMDEEPEQAAGRMTVWWDDEEMKYFTNFPLSAEDMEAEQRFQAENENEYYTANIHQIGSFGHCDYRRALTPHELAAHKARILRALAPWTDAARAARELWFGEHEAA